MLFDPILVITRPKKNGAGTHWGVRFPNGVVYDYVYGVNLRRTDDDGFADGADVAIVLEIPWHQAHLVRYRLEELERNPRKYDGLNWNCESFAKWLTTGEARSDQVIGALVLAGIVAVLYIAAK